jgi:hypothetical protein
MTGSVSGITTMVVTPPAAAAWLAGLAGKNLHVDQPGAQHVALAVDDFGTLGRIAPQVAAQIGDLGAFDEQPARFILARGRIDQARVEENRCFFHRSAVLAHATFLDTLKTGCFGRVPLGHFQHATSERFAKLTLLNDWVAAAPWLRGQPCARRRPFPLGRE